MYTLNPKIDLYIANGCGRCAYYATPQCKVKKWQLELEALRQILLDCDLTEELKWSVPCYTYNKNNIVIIAAFKDYCSISFFKGALLLDAHKIFYKSSESMQSVRFIKFFSLKEIVQQAAILKTYIKEAIEIEHAKLKVTFKKNIEPIPEELLNKFKEHPRLKKSFYALPPSKQRGYIIFFSQTKNVGTRITSIEKCIEKISNGHGLNEK